MDFLGDSWDVYQLLTGFTDSKYSGTGTTAKGINARTTVAFDPSSTNVYFGSSVAYSLWGKAFSLCKNWATQIGKTDYRKGILSPRHQPFTWSKTNAKYYVDLYKHVQIILAPVTSYQHPVDLNGALAFTEYGYDGPIPQSGTAVDDVSTIGINSLKFDGDLEWAWLPHQDPNNKMARHQDDKVATPSLFSLFDLCCDFRDE